MLPFARREGVGDEREDLDDDRFSKNTQQEITSPKVDRVAGAPRVVLL